MKCPFVGPRPLEPEDRIFGRDDEAAEIVDLLIAERALLIFATSGAGKTSLVNAAIVPQMEAEGFLVLPTIRLAVQRDVPATSGNRFVDTTLAELESFGTSRMGADALDLHTVRLPDYMAQRSWLRSDDRPKLLVFDQFEELLTSATGRGEAEAFISQLAEALHDRELWALFVLREQNLAAFETYATMFPGQLATRYRLSLLDEDAAADAIAATAALGGVQVQPPAARRLARNLAGRGQRYVEPLHLQLVCERRWPEWSRAGTVTGDDIGQPEDVDSALCAYYDASLSSVVEANAVDEGVLRQWFETTLISPQGVRTQVLGTSTSVGELDSSIVGALIDRHIVRQDERRGRVWYELAHDRLIRAVRSSNETWFRSNQGDLSSSAWLWARQGRDQRLLLPPAQLREAARAVERGRVLSTTEDEFVAASREAARRNRQRRLLVGGLMVALLLIVGIVLKANRDLATASEEIEAERARAEAERARVVSILRENNLLATLREGANHRARLTRVLKDISQKDFRGARVQLDEIFDSGPQGSLLRDAQISRWLIALRSLEGQRIERLNVRRAQRLALGPSGSVQAVAADRGSLTLLKAGSGGTTVPVEISKRLHLVDAAFSGSGRWLAAGGWDAGASRSKLGGYALQLFRCTGGESWPCETKPASFPWQVPGGVAALSFSDQVDHLAVATNDCEKGTLPESTPEGAVQSRKTQFCSLALIDLTGRAPELIRIEASEEGDDVLGLRINEEGRASFSIPDGAISAVDLSADGRLLAIAQAGAELVKVYQLEPLQLLWTLNAGSPIVSLDFGPTSLPISLAAGASNGRVLVWSGMELGSQPGVPALLAGTGRVNEILMLGQGQVAAADFSGNVSVWDVDSERLVNTLVGADEPIVSFGGSLGHGIFGVTRSGDVWSWDTASQAAERREVVFDLGESRKSYCLRRRCPPGRTWPMSVALSVQTGTMIVGLAGGGIQAIDGETGETRWADWEAHRDRVTRVKVSPDGKTLATASKDRTVRLFSVDDGRPLGIGPVQHDGTVFDIDFAPDGRWLATAGFDERVVRLNLETGRSEVFISDVHAERNADVNSVRFLDSPDQLLITTNLGPELLSIVDGVASYSPQGAERSTKTLSAERSSQGALIEGGYYGRLSVSRDGREAVLISPHHNHVARVEIGPEGLLAFAAAADAAVSVWSLQSDDPELLSWQLPAHPRDRSVLDFDLACSPEGGACQLAVPLYHEGAVAVYRMDGLYD